MRYSSSLDRSKVVSVSSPASLGSSPSLPEYTLECTRSKEET
ncbi:hypothetical protein SGLAM104S_10160 [Streptomyces glaucescens]